MEKSQVHFARNRPKSNTLTCLQIHMWAVPRSPWQQFSCNHRSTAVTCQAPQMVANAYRLQCHFGGGATGASKTPLALFRSIRSPRLQNDITAYISIGYLDGHQ